MLAVEPRRRCATARSDRRRRPRPCAPAAAIMPAQPLLVGRATAEIDAQRQRHRHQAGVLAGEEEDQEVRRGIGDDRDPRASRQPERAQPRAPDRPRARAARDKAASARDRHERRRSCSRSGPWPRSRGRPPGCRSRRSDAARSDWCSAWQSSRYLVAAYQPGPQAPHAAPYVASPSICCLVAQAWTRPAARGPCHAFTRRDPEVRCIAPSPRRGPCSLAKLALKASHATPAPMVDRDRGPRWLSKRLRNGCKIRSSGHPGRYSSIPAAGC